jgi:GTP cyclohydrolase I
MASFDDAKIEQGVRLILEGIGEDAERGGLKDTPARVARMFREIAGGVGRIRPASSRWSRAPTDRDDHGATSLYSVCSTT